MTAVRPVQECIKSARRVISILLSIMMHVRSSVACACDTLTCLDVLLVSSIFFALTTAASVWLVSSIQRLKEETRQLRMRNEELARRLAAIEDIAQRREPQPEPVPVTAHPIQPVSVPTRPPRPAAVPQPARDWEAIVGANWLNRLGALVLVIGMALFLGYSLAHLGPAGKLAIGLATGIAMICAGFALESRPLYRTFSRGLTGAGWAVTYFTAYAAYALPAARIIESAPVAILALAAISAGMIAHSLRYQSQSATALAYLLSFAGINAGPLTSFSLAATFLLAISLIALSWRFGWFHLPLLGVLLTYGSFALRYDVSGYGIAGVLNSQVTLWIYWLTFELYDLLDLRRRPVRQERESIFALNAGGFATAAVIHGLQTGKGGWPGFLGLASVAYLASAIVRARLVGSRHTNRGYETAAVVSVAFLAAALMAWLQGVRTTWALAIEGELIILAAVSLGSRVLRLTGVSVLLLSTIHLLTFDIFPKMPPLPGGFARWTPGALLLGLIFSGHRRFLGGWYNSAVAGLVLSAAAVEELPRLLVGPAMAASAAGLIALRARDLRYLGLVALFLAAARALFVNLDASSVITSAFVVLCIYAAQLLWPARTGLIRYALTIVGTGVLTLLLVKEVSPGLLTVASGLAAGALLAAGFAVGERPFRIAGLALFVLCITRLFLHDLRELDTVFTILAFIVLGIVLLGASWLYTRFRGKLGRLI